MFTNNTSKTGAMSNYTSQAIPLNTVKLSSPPKRRRSQELPQSERSVSRHGADPSNRQGSLVSKRDEKRRSSDTTENNQERKARGDKRQRISGAFNPVHSNKIHRQSDQQEARQQPAQTAESFRIDPVLPEEGRLRVGIVTWPPVLFGVASLRPGAFRSLKLGVHLAPAQSPLVSQDVIARSSPPFASYKSLESGFDSLSAGNESFRQKFVDTKEALFGVSAVGTTKQAPLAQGPCRKKAFEVWKDIPQSFKPKDCKPTAPGPLRDVTNIQEREVALRQIPSETGQEPAVALRRPRRRMRIEAGEHHHPNLKAFKFPQGAASGEQAIEEVAESGENASATEAPQQSQHVEEPSPDLAMPPKRKADNDLRERILKKLKTPGDQPLPFVGNGGSQTAPIQNFTSEYFAEYAKPLLSVTLKDVIHEAAPDQKDPVVCEGASNLIEAQQVPLAVTEPILNDKSSPTVNDSEIQPNPSQEPEHDEPVSSFARLASSDPEAILNKLSQDRESSARDGTALWEFTTHRTPSPAIKAVITPEVASIVVPTVPSWIAESSRYAIEMNIAYSEGYNPEHPQDYKGYIAQFTARPAASRPKEYEYRPMPEMLDVEILNQRLNWVVPDVGEAPGLFRELPVPPPHIDSELTRCVRFAQSDSQKRVDWRAHPNHVAEIIQRTNFYGMELLISRAYMRISSPPTKDEFELAMATRLAHASFGKDPVAYIAADVPALSDYLVENLPSAKCLIPNKDKDHFSDFTKYYRMELAEKYPPLSVVGLPTWQLLLDGERGQPSLKAQSLQHIIDSIREQATQVPGDGRGAQPLEDGLPHENAELRNEDLTSYRPDSDPIHNLNDGNLDGGFGWNIGEFNADSLNEDCVRAWEDISASLAAQCNNEKVAERFSDPVDHGACEGALEPIADLYSRDEFWTNQDLSAPWDFGQDDSAPGFDVVPSEAPAAEPFLGQNTGIPFDSDAETDEWL